MKPSALRAIQHSIRFSLRLALLSLVFSVCSFAAVAAQSAFHFDLDQYRGASLTYFLVATGTLLVEDESNRDRSRFTSRSPLPLTLHFRRRPPTAIWGLDACCERQVVLGLGEFGRQTFDPISLGGRLGPGGALREIETPPFLTDLGLDMTDLIIGLIVPGPVPPRTITPGAEWRATFNRGNCDQRESTQPQLDGDLCGGPPGRLGQPHLAVGDGTPARRRDLREGLHAHRDPGDWPCPFFLFGKMASPSSHRSVS